MWDGETKEALGGGKVYLEMKIPALAKIFYVFTCFEDTSIGDDDIQTTMLGDNSVYCGFQSGIICDVTDNSRETRCA